MIDVHGYVHWFPPGYEKYNFDGSNYVHAVA